MDDRTDLQVIMDQLNEAISYLALLGQGSRKVVRYRLVDPIVIWAGGVDIDANLEMGYVLYGNPFSDGKRIWQAIVKYEETNDNNGIYG